MQRVTIPDPLGALAAASAPTPLIVTGPRDTASHRHPASPSLAPTRRLSSPFRSACSQRPPPPITGRTERRRQGSRRLSHPAPGFPPPSTQRTTRRVPAAQPAGAAVAPPSAPTAYSLNNLQPPRFCPSKASPKGGEGFPRRRAPDAARARHFRPNGRRGRQHEAGRRELGSSEDPAAARARDSPSITAASDTEHPVPRTPARWWPTWRRENASKSGTSRAERLGPRSIRGELWRCGACALRAPPRPPTLSRAGLGESTWSVGRQRAPPGRRVGLTSWRRGGREGAWSEECPGGRGWAGRHPGATPQGLALG